MKIRHDFQEQLDKIVVATSTGQLAIFADVAVERARQEQLKASGKFRRTCADEMSNAERFAVLGEEVGEVGHEVNEEFDRLLDPRRGTLREELVQVMAVALAWIEGLDGEEKVGG